MILPSPSDGVVSFESASCASGRKTLASEKRTRSPTRVSHLLACRNRTLISGVCGSSVSAKADLASSLNRISDLSRRRGHELRVVMPDYAVIAARQMVAEVGILTGTGDFLSPQDLVSCSATIGSPPSEMTRLCRGVTGEVVRPELVIQGPLAGAQPPCDFTPSLSALANRALQQPLFQQAKRFLERHAIIENRGP